MADAGEKKVKILILVPLITTALSMLTWLGISFLMLRVLIAVLLFTDIWLYNVLFSDHKPPEPRPVTTRYVESVTGDAID